MGDIYQLDVNPPWCKIEKRNVHGITSWFCQTKGRGKCLQVIKKNVMWIEPSSKGLVWNDQHLLKEHGFKLNEYNHNLYYLNQGGKNIIIVLYVDDLVLIGNDSAKH